MVNNRNVRLTNVKIISFWVFISIGVFFLGIFILNLNLPHRSTHLDILNTDEQARLLETDHLRRSLGNEVWPGFGQLHIPVMLYNEAYVFLSGVTDPGIGWIKVPFAKQTGIEWTLVHSENEQPYYRQPISSTGKSPQTFIVQAGGYYSVSIATKEWTKITLIEYVKKDLPTLIKPIFPYTIIAKRYNSDKHISSIIHESFHAFQAQHALEKVRSSKAYTTYENSYPWKDPDFRDAWLNERLLLAKILQTHDDQKFRELILQWLELRRNRHHDLTNPKFVFYEKEREWLEGLAKYTELKIQLLASDTDIYNPLPDMKNDPDFNYYQQAVRIQKRELKHLQSDLFFNQTVMHYSGWAQAQILDRLGSNWKSRIFEPGVYLDDLIQLTIDSTPLAVYN